MLCDRQMQMEVHNVGGLVGSTFLWYDKCLLCDGSCELQHLGNGVGGLVGENNFGTISASYATGAMRDGSNLMVGGLVGYNFGTISGSYFDSNVSNRPAIDSYSKTTSELQSPTRLRGHLRRLECGCR